MAIKFGITDKGFISPTYEEWLDSIQDDLKSRFGDDIALSSNSNFGIIAEMFAWRLTEIAQQLELVYYSGFFSTANDTALDRLGATLALQGRLRLSRIFKLLFKLMASISYRLAKSSKLMMGLFLN